jgi:rod shape determining protein RodA
VDLSFLQRVIPRKPATNPLGLRGSYADPIRNIDWVLLSAVIAQAVIGLFTVFSATRQRLIDQRMDVFVYTQRQVLFVIIAAAVMAIVMALGHDWFRAQSGFLYGGILVALMMVLGAGAVTGGARLAFDFGPFSIQPAELAKPVLLILVASYLSESVPDRIDWHHFVMTLYIVLIPCGLILMQPDLGSASVILAGVAGILYIGNARRRYLALIGGMFVGTALALPGRSICGMVFAKLKQQGIRNDCVASALCKACSVNGWFFWQGIFTRPVDKRKVCSCPIH